MALASLPPLHVHLLFHPGSATARKLAEELMTDWMPEPTVPDLRVPVFLTPDRGDGLPPTGLNLDTAEHTLVAVLIDDHMADFIDGQGQAWLEWLHEMARIHPPGGRHHVLPIVLDLAGFEVVELRHAVNVVNDSNVRATVSFALSVRALHLLRNPAQLAHEASDARQLEAPVTLFMSHAKADLDDDKLDPVGLTQIALEALPVYDWYDARRIRYGANFSEEIRAGIEKADAVMVFLTDTWSSRPWCVTEALLAKEIGTPTLVVDALVDEEARTFPYGGNTRTLRWRPATRPAPGEDLVAFRARGIAEGKRMIAAAVRRALMTAHARRRLAGLAEPGDVILDTAPEAARVAWKHAKSTFFYPDPPISSDERRLLSNLLPEADFVTPMIRLARRRATAPTTALAVSISLTDDLRARGLTSHHLRLISDEVHLYLLLAGMRIVYGGKLDPGKFDNPDNFTVRLFGLVRRYANLAKDAGAEKLEPIINAAPWPSWTQYGLAVNAFFGRVAMLERIGLPGDFSVPIDELEPDKDGFVPPNSPLRRYAWGRALTHMREWVTSKSVGRLAIGGPVEGYNGRMAGILEEALIQLRADKPLFLVGGLGGCTQLVIDLLEGRERPEMRTEIARARVEDYDDIVARYARHGGAMPTREEIAAELHDKGREGPAAALKNGLDDSQNRELFSTTDPLRIAELVLTGLSNLGL